MVVYRGGTIINISGTTPIDDPEYRYKMPAVFGKIEGSGNGIKTAIPNISEVAMSLHRQAGEVNKFFGTELGAQTRYSPETDRAIVNGAHTDMVLQEKIHVYIEKFVLCPTCNLPETEYKIKGDCIYHRCKACGAKEMVDMSHKLCNYILAEDKKAKKEAKSKGKNKKDEKTDEKKSKKKDNGSEGGSDDDKKKKKDKKKDKKSKKKDKSDGNTNGDGDYIKEAMFGKKEEDFPNDDDDDSSSGLDEAVDDEGAMLLAVEATKKYVAENPTASPSEIAEVVTNQQMASALKSHDKVHILVRAVLTPSFFKNKEIPKHAPAISAVTSGNKVMERHLISALELLCVDKPKNFPVAIKQFYDEDALDEVTILEWANEGRSEFTLTAVDEETRAVLRGEAEPVIVWLEEAESDEDSNSDEE